MLAACTGYRSGPRATSADGDQSTPDAVRSLKTRPVPRATAPPCRAGTPPRRSRRIDTSKGVEHVLRLECRQPALAGSVDPDGPHVHRPQRRIVESSFPATPKEQSPAVAGPAQLAPRRRERAARTCFRRAQQDGVLARVAGDQLPLGRPRTHEHRRADVLLSPGSEIPQARHRWSTLLQLRVRHAGPGGVEPGAQDGSPAPARDHSVTGPPLTGTRQNAAGPC
jgi:hypothetical protein